MNTNSSDSGSGETGSTTPVRSGVAPADNDIIVEESNQFSVFISRKRKNVCFQLFDVQLSSDVKKVLSDARLLGSIPTGFLNDDSNRLFKRMVAETMVLALEGNLEAAKVALAKAEQFLKDRAGEAARLWHVQAVVLIVLVFYLLFPVWERVASFSQLPAQTAEKASEKNEGDAAATEDQKEREEAAEKRNADKLYTAKIYAIALVGGALGAGFSLLLRLPTLPVDPAAGRAAHFGEAFFRMSIGAISAIIIVIGLLAKVFPGILSDIAPPDGIITAEHYYKTFWLLAIFSIAAGASERWVPSLLKQLTDDSKDNATTSPTAANPTTAEPSGSGEEGDRENNRSEN